MNKINLFETPIYITKLNLNLDELKKHIQDFKLNVSSTNKSGRGNYQGHGFWHQDLVDEIVKNFPSRKDKSEIKLKLNFWVNINSPGSYNVVHSHNPHAGTILSGVFYVQTPQNCGEIRFYDPRFSISTAPDMMYYYDQKEYHYFTPESNLLILFPVWLKHDVAPNLSNEDRISISFNLCAVDYDSLYLRNPQ